VNRIEFGDLPDMPPFRYEFSKDQILALAIYIRSFARKEGEAAAPPPPSSAGLTPLQTYRAYCLACHNVDGRGEIVRPGMPDIPDFTSAAWPGAKIDDDLAKAILSGGKFMPPMRDKLNPEQAAKMVAFVRAFKDGKQVVAAESTEMPLPKKEPPKETVNNKDTPPKQEKGPLEVSPDLAQRLRSASVIFRQYCIACHGPDGTGVAAMRASLPTLPDFTRPAFQEQHSNPQLLVSILDGKARDLVAFIRAFGPPGSGGGAETTASSNEFQRQFEQLQRQWEALEKDIKALKKESPK
jgi:mono/diheme cytochrome c family protein